MQVERSKHVRAIARALRRPTRNYIDPKRHGSAAAARQTAIDGPCVAPGRQAPKNAITTPLPRNTIRRGAGHGRSMLFDEVMLRWDMSQDESWRRGRPRSGTAT